MSAPILLVDDHPMVRDVLRAVVRAVFPATPVLEAGNAAEALASISACHPDLVLLDINLPGENGIGLARRIRAADKRVKILMVAGEADPWAVNQALEAGACGFVTKTSPVGFLGQAIKAVLEGQMVLCPDTQAALQRVGQSGWTPGEPPGPAILSEREREILKHLAHGETTKAIAGSLRISPKTVETHRQHIMRKLGVNSVAALTRYAIRHGLTLA